MRVLWFTNTPANADEYFNYELKGTGGWLKSLDQTLQDHVELHVAFKCENNDYNSFQYKKTIYHPINTNESVFTKFVRRYANKIDVEKHLNKYLEIIKEVNPDIIHIHGTENTFGCLIPHTNIPVVVSIQGNITVCLYKFFSGFEKRYSLISNRSLFKMEKLLFPHRFHNNYRFFLNMQKVEERYLQMTKNLIGRTLWDRRITRILAPASQYYHGDEVLRDSFYINQWVSHDRQNIIIHTTSGNTFYKGFETICLALFELNKIGLNCEWRVAGVNDNDLIVSITKKKLKDKYPEKGLVLIGQLNENDLINKLFEADFYVMASHIENSPNNLCEAMMLGMPCISTFAGGSGSLIVDNIEGVLIQDGDPWAMAGAIIELVNDKEKAICLGKMAREKALLRHNRQRIVSDLLDTYECIISGSK